MKTHKFVAAVLMVGISFLLLSGVGNGATKPDFEPPVVTMITCLPSFAGSESISLTPEFTITNPNDCLIGLTLDYKLKAGDQLVGTSMVPTLYVPAKGQVQVRDTVIMPFMAWFASELVSGKSKKEAVGIVAPLWKGLGAKRPAALPEELWKKLPDNKPAMTATGSVFITTESGQKMFRFTSEWQDTK